MSMYCGEAFMRGAEAKQTSALVPNISSRFAPFPLQTIPVSSLWTRMLHSDEKWEKREARIRGSGTRDVEIDGFSISSPECSKQGRLLQTLDSELIKPEDHTRQRLRQHTPKVEKTQPKHTLKMEVETEVKLRRENRKLAFSSDGDNDDEEEEHQDALFRRVKRRETLVKHEDQYEHDYELYDHPMLEIEAEPEPASDRYEPDYESKFSPVRKEQYASPADNNNNDIYGAGNDSKRRRGRPKQEEREEKAAVVTRRLRRIVDNPSLRHAHVPDPLKLSVTPKPFRVLGLALWLPNRLQNGRKTLSKAALLSAKPNGKQKGMAVDAERTFTASTRHRRVQINTLDVLQHFVEEHTPRPAQNESVNENTILTEFKAHLRYNLQLLMDLHAAIVDISLDINDLQRQKNDVRRDILELRKKHANVGAELARERKHLADTKREHQEFMAMANSLHRLKAAVSDSDTIVHPAGISELLLETLAETSRVVHPIKGLQAQLRSINAGLSETIGKL